MVLIILVLTSSSDLYSWGSNKYGQLGLGNNNNQSSPQKIKFFNSISPKSLSFCSFNYHQRKILKEKRRKIVNILLLGRKYCEFCPFYQDLFPLDLFKFILKLSFLTK